MRDAMKVAKRNGHLGPLANYSSTKKDAGSPAERISADESCWMEELERKRAKRDIENVRNERKDLRPKRGNWVMVKNDAGEEIIVKVTHPRAGKNGWHFLARVNIEEVPVLYYRSQFIGVPQDEKKIKKLQAEYFSKKPAKKMKKDADKKILQRLEDWHKRSNDRKFKIQDETLVVNRITMKKTAKKMKKTVKRKIIKPVFNPKEANVELIESGRY